jgi:excisionase family DNA binding protein
VTGRPVARRLLTATQIAAFCDVDLKTIHNWADRGKIRGWRTTGRHLRFRRLDVVDFLRTYGFPIPDALKEGRPRIVAIESDGASLAWIERTLSRRFDVEGFDHVIDGLLALAGADADVALLGEVSPLDVSAIAERLRAVGPTAHVRVVTLASTPPSGAAALPSAPRGDAARLREVLERVTGLA